MNVITIAGRLARDPEAKGQGTAFTVAADSGFGDKKVTMFYRCYAGGNQADFCQKYLQKGSSVTVVGDFKAQMSESNGKTYLNLDVYVYSVKSNSSQAQQAAALPKVLPVQPQQDQFDDIPF